nr:hypothetical protein [Actinosynnema sp. ALI-1.44]
MATGPRAPVASGPIRRPICLVRMPIAVASAKASNVTISPIHSVR